MKHAEHTVPMGWYQRKAHEEADYIFQNLLPKHGLKVRKEQLRLSHEMLDTLWGNHIALCDAGVGIGKTYAYLAVCILQEKYREKSRGISETSCRPAVISTSSIALQEAIMQEYIPFLSRILLEEKLIRIPLKAAVRKGKEHFVCDSRLEQRLLAIRGKRKNEEQRQALFALRTCYDMDQVHGLSGFDRRLVCVPRFCPRNCLGKETCRYHRYMERAKGAGIHFQICNHNYLLADASHRAKGYRPLLSDYRALVVDEAHKLPEAAGQMCGKSLCRDDILELCFLLEKEHQGIRAGCLKSMMKRLFQVIAANHTFAQGQRVAFRQTKECVSTIKESAAFLFEMGRRCRGSVYQLLRKGLSYPLVEVWCHTQEEIMRFKKMGNAVLFAADSCWEGVDFPGARVSSLIIVRLPFAVPDPVWEAEKERYRNLREYIGAVAVPDMQKKLRQGFGRAIRTETDTCVVTILDHRAARGGRYYEDVLSALPPCEMAESIEDVGRFIGKRKNIEYYM